MKSIFAKVSSAAEKLFDRSAKSLIQFVHNHRTYDTEMQVHGFYRLETPSGRFLGYRHHCRISGDWPVLPPKKGTAVVHCPDRKRDVFEPDAAMPTVVRRPSTQDELFLPNGDRLLFMD